MPKTEKADFDQRLGWAVPKQHWSKHTTESCLYFNERIQKQFQNIENTFFNQNKYYF